jgi:hypothetical protein
MRRIGCQERLLRCDEKQYALVDKNLWLGDEVIVLKVKNAD